MYKYYEPKHCWNTFIFVMLESWLGRYVVFLGKTLNWYIASLSNQW